MSVLYKYLLFKCEDMIMLFLLLPLLNRNFHSFSPYLADPLITSFKGNDTEDTSYTRLKKKKEIIRKTSHHKKDKPD